MRRQWNPRVRLLVVAATVEAAIAFTLRLDNVTGATKSGAAWATVMSAVGLAWLFVLVFALYRVVQHVSHLDRAVSRGSRAIADHAVASHEWLWECSLDLIWTYCGPRVTEFLDYAPDDLVGRSMLELLPAD